MYFAPSSSEAKTVGVVRHLVEVGETLVVDDRVAILVVVVVAGRLGCGVAARLPVVICSGGMWW